MLTRVSNVFFSMNSAITNEEMQGIAKEVAPMLSKHGDDITLNDELFQRIKTVYEQKDKLNLTAEQDKLLDESYKDFVRGGANLDDDKKAEMRKVNE